MRLRFTAFLVIANLVVFGLIWQGARHSNQQQPTTELVFPVNADRIVLSGPDAPGSYTLQLKDGRWALAAPYQWPANVWTVQKILDELRAISLEGGFTIDEAGKLGNTLASYGLDNPGMTLVVGAGGRDTLVKVGALTADGNAAYLLAPDGKTILFAGKSLLTALARKPEDLRRTEVISLDPFEITGVSVLLDGAKSERVGLKRGRAAGAADAASWRFETPVATDADTPLVDKELASLAELRFRRFFEATPELLEKHGLASPGISLTLEGNNRRQTLLVGHPDTTEKTPYRFAKFKDTAVIFTLPEASLSAWVDARRVLREHRFLRFDADALVGLTVHKGGRSLVLQRLDVRKGGQSEWHMPVRPGSTAVEALPVDNELLGNLITALTNLTARDTPVPAGADAAKAALCAAFVSDDPTEAQLAEWGFANPVRKVDLALRSRGADGKDTERTLTLSIAEPIAPGLPYHAKLSDSPTVYTVPPAVLELLSVQPHAYRRRSVDTLAPGARVAALKITDLRTGNVLLNEQKPADISSWETWLERRSKEERSAILALVASCLDVRASAFIGHAYADDYRHDAQDGSDAEPWRYQLEYTVTSAEGGKSEARVLRFTRRLSGTKQVGGMRETNAVFELNQDWIDALKPLTFERDSSVELPTMPVPAPAGGPPAK